MVARTAAAIVVLSLALLGASDAARAQEEPVLLKIPRATLEDAFAQLAREHGLYYVIAEGRGEPKKVALAGNSMYELVTRLLHLFGATGAEIDGLWLVDGAPPADPVEVLVAATPPSLTEKPGQLRGPTGGDGRLLITALRELWRPHEGTPPPPEGKFRLLPFEVRDPAQAERLFALTAGRMLASLVAFLGSPRMEARGILRLEEGGILRLEQDGRRVTLGAIREGRVLPTPRDEASRLPLLESLWAPREVRRGWAQAPATHLPPLDFAGSATDLAAVLTDLLPADLRAEDIADVRLSVLLPECPAWIVLTALSVATGRLCDYSDDFETYRFPAPMTLERAAFAAMKADERLAYLQLRYGIGVTLYGMQVWTGLTQAQRERLRDGQTVAVEDIPAEAVRWIQRALAAFRAGLVTGEARRIDSWAQGRGCRGVFVLNHAGSIYLKHWVRDGEFTGYHIFSAAGDVLKSPTPGAVREEGLGFLRQPMNLFSDRWQRAALPADYGTRDQTGPHVKRRHEPALLAGPVNGRRAGLE